MTFRLPYALPLGALLLAAGLMLAASPLRAAELVNATGEGVAIDGFDAVAYFVAERPVKGRADYSLDYKGVTWHFASAKNRDAFAADPAKYEPQHNGWCSYAVSEGYGAEVDFVRGWAVIDGKLYMNWDEETKDAFVDEADARLPKATENWSGVHAGMQDGSVEIYRHASEGVDIVHPQDAPE